MSASALSTPTPLMISAFIKSCVKTVALPLVGVAVFLLIWEFGSSKIQTSLGNSPAQAL